MSTPAAGSKLADFTLKVATKEGVADFKLSEHLGKGPIVLGVFPLAFTGVCTKEMCDFRDNLGALASLHAQVFGLSIDTPFANKAFAAEQNLPFGILSDPNREFIGKVWPMMPNAVGGVVGVAKRGAMIINSDGTVKWASASDDVKTWVGVAEIQKHL
ncbi:MAG: redoxin domain-containing protein [Candidatus Thermoplasmatota archaeon]